jgi:steroid delta-isomerase-like uncharacterized protein
MPRSSKANGTLAEDASRRARSFYVRGPRLRRLRVGRGWTQLEAAERAGLSERLLRKAEAGEAIEIQSITILAGLYSTPTSRLTPNDLVVGSNDDARPTSQTAEVEALARRWYDELWNKGRLEVIDELSSPDAMLHSQGESLSRDAARRRFSAIRAAFSEFDFVIDQLAVLGSLAVVRWHVQLTHIGCWMGEPPSGRRLTIHGSSWIRIEDGLLQEGWDYWDQQQVRQAAP